ncbi:YdaU family protein, partial [Methylobacterium sp. E-045]|uniref:YdaU family protein n=1 Tax=Methylobacterium sp. E-045 TaxID=2836575 RepID=UPI001FBB7726
FRAAILLWCASWHQAPAGSLPKDPKQLSKFAGYGRVVAEWERVAEGALYGWVECSDGRLYHPVFAEKAIEAWEKKEEYTQRTTARTEQAKAAAGARWGKKDGPASNGGGSSETGGNGSDAGGDAPVNADALPTQMRPHAGSNAEREGKGQVRDHKALRAAHEPEIRKPDEVEIWVRSLVDGTHPVTVEPDVTPIRALLREPGITRADVEAGIAAFMAKSRKRATCWESFDKWIRTAAKDRIAREPAGVRPDAPRKPVTPEMIRFQQVHLASEHFRGHWSDAWPNHCRPGHPDCTTPDDVIEDARIAVQMESLPNPNIAREMGFAPDRFSRFQ